MAKKEEETEELSAQDRIDAHHWDLVESGQVAAGFKDSINPDGPGGKDSDS